MNEPPSPAPSTDPPKPPVSDPVSPSDSPTRLGPAAAPPPAAKIVLEGKKTERELHLERTLKERESRLAELEDENRQLKTSPAAPKPARKKSWLEGATFFEENED